MHDEIGRIIELIKEHAGIFEVHHVTKFKCYRSGKHGEHGIELTVLDAGPKNPLCRYSVIARREEDGLIARGNCAESLHGALTAVHWSQLDAPLPGEAPYA